MLALDNSNTATKAEMQRCFEDNPSRNNFHYRESEAHGRINKDKKHLRGNDPSTRPPVYTQLNNEDCYCEEYRIKDY